jgi:hypothetical protein
MRFVARHSKLFRHLLALFVFSLAALTFFHSVAAHPGSRVSCCTSDGTSTIRDLWLDSYLGKSPWTLTHDPYNAAPEGVPRTPATALANGGVQTALLWWSRGVLGFVGGWNAFAFVGLVGTSLATFALLDWLGCTLIASLFGGYVFGFSPYALARVYFGHLGLMQNWVFVVAVAAMLAVRSGRTYPRALLAGLAVALAFYVSAYQGLFAGLIVAAFYVIDFIRIRGNGQRFRTFALASASVWTSVVALSPLLVLYSRQRATISGEIGHSFGDLYGFAAQMSGYFLPSPLNPLFHWVAGSHAKDLNEQSNFFGYTTLLLAIAAVVLAIRRNRWLRESEARWSTALSMIVLAPAAFALSLPPSYHVGGVPIPTPSSLLGIATTFWRVYARFGILVGFALAVLAALALSALARRPGRFWYLLGPVAFLVVYFELLPGNIGAFPTNAGAAPAWVTWLAQAPRGIVATYPLNQAYGPPNELSQSAFFWQTVDHDPSFSISNLTYQQYLSRLESVRLLASDLRDPLAAKVLASKGVRYVLVDPASYRALKQKPPRLDPSRFSLLARRDGVRIYSVHAPTVDVSEAIRANAARLRQLRDLPPLRARRRG